MPQDKVLQNHQKQFPVLDSIGLRPAHFARLVPRFYRFFPAPVVLSSPEHSGSVAKDLLQPGPYLKAHTRTLRNFSAGIT